MSSSTMIDSHSPSSDLVSLRNFVVDEDRANLYKSVDKTAFIIAQREAIEAFNLAKAIRLSEESAANENRIRAEQSARSLARPSWNPERPSTRHPSSSSTPSSSSSPSRPILSRGLSTSDNTPQPSPPSSSPPKVSSASAAAAESSSSHQKRRKASVSVSTQPTHPQYTYSSSGYYYPYQSHNSNTPHSESRKQSVSSSSSASSRDIQAGQILNPKESSSRSSSASAQAAAAEKEKEKEKERARSRSNSNSNSSSTRKRSSSSAALPQPSQPQVQVQVQSQVPPQNQTQNQQQVPTTASRDIFAPLRFNCTTCGNLIQSSTDTSTQSDLHVICQNPSCGAVHCRGCLQGVKCRDFEHSSDSQALVPISFFITSTPSNPTSPIRPTFTSSKSQSQHTQRPCAGGPGCALWNCCPTVRVIAIWEALRSFDALFAAEAGFQVYSRTGQISTTTSSQAQPSGEVGRSYRDAYVRMVISKPDKNMRKFEDRLVKVLKTIVAWLQAARQFCNPEDGSRRHSTLTISDPDQSHDDRDTFLLHLAKLFLSSHLLEVVYSFLSNRNVKDWMTHAETYLDILDLVGKMMDCRLGFLLEEVSGLPTPSFSYPSGFYNPFGSASGSTSTSTSTSSSLSSSPSQSPPQTSIALSSSPSSSAMTATTTGSSSSSSPPPTLYDVVSQLEAFRGDLKKFLTRVSFGVTVDKASKLHEAITYLVLQLVVGEF